jgi:anti-anti-sigma factor
MPRETDEPIGKNKPAQLDFTKRNSFQCDSSGDEVIVSAIGEVDLANVSMFDSMLQTALLSRKPIRIDLTHCTYLDSTLINSIMNVALTIRVQLRITAKAASIRRIFEIVGMDKVVPIDYIEG